MLTGNRGEKVARRAVHFPRTSAQEMFASLLELVNHVVQNVWNKARKFFLADYHDKMDV